MARVIRTIALGRYTAKIVKDLEWDEFRAEFYKEEQGRQVKLEDASYHAGSCLDRDNYADCENTAHSILKRYNEQEPTNAPA